MNTALYALLVLIDSKGREEADLNPNGDDQTASDPQLMNANSSIN